MSILDSFRLPDCGTCVHLLNGGDGARARCIAFPTGIPEDILSARTGHRDPYPGDNGIRYELADEFKAPTSRAASTR